MARLPRRPGGRRARAGRRGRVASGRIGARRPCLAAPPREGPRRLPARVPGRGGGAARPAPAIGRARGWTPLPAGRRGAPPCLAPRAAALRRGPRSGRASGCSPASAGADPPPRPSRRRCGPTCSTPPGRRASLCLSGFGVDSAAHGRAGSVERAARAAAPDTKSSRCSGQPARARRCSCQSACPRCGETGYMLVPSRPLRRGAGLRAAGTSRSASRSSTRSASRRRSRSPPSTASSAWSPDHAARRRSPRTSRGSSASDEPMKGFLLYGRPGAGKTHLLCAALR